MIMKADIYSDQRPSTKRPKIIFLIAIWVFYQKVFFIHIPLGLIETIVDLSHNTLDSFSITLTLCILILLFSFVNLLKLPRIVVISLLSIAIIFNIHAIFYGMTLKGYFIAPNARSIMVLSICLIINMVIIYYLTSKSTIQLSENYRNEITAIKKRASEL